MVPFPLLVPHPLSVAHVTVFGKWGSIVLLRLELGFGTEPPVPAVCDFCFTLELFLCAGGGDSCVAPGVWLPPVPWKWSACVQLPLGLWSSLPWVGLPFSGGRFESLHHSAVPSSRFLLTFLVCSRLLLDALVLVYDIVPFLLC